MISLIKSQPFNPRLHFRRFEFKYLLTPADAEKIKTYLSPYIVRDPFVEKSGQEKYEVLSLYYDTPLFYYYYEKKDGVKKRKKVRWRTYRTGNTLSPYVFFEVKRKDDVIVSKDRFIMSLPDYQAWRAAGDFSSFYPAADANTQALIKEFQWERARRAIRPMLLVTYEREPFIAKFNNNVRITFDTSLRAVENDDILYSGSDLTDVLGPLVVMEIKFNGTLPAYIHQAIQVFNLKREAYSKYCHGLERSGGLSHKIFPARYLSRANSLLG